MPQLKHIIGETWFEPKSDDERRFFHKHISVLFKNIYATNEFDNLFKGTNIKVVDRPGTHHGYTVGDDEKVYESVEEMYGSDSEASVEGPAPSDSYSDTHNGARQYLKIREKKHPHKNVPVGHIMTAICKTAEECKVPKLMVQTEIGANAWSHHGESTTPHKSYAKDIRGGSNGASGLTNMAWNKKAKRIFNKRVGEAVRNGAPANMDHYKESLEIRAMDAADHLQELTENLSGRPTSVHKAINALAKQHALPPIMAAIHVAVEVGKNHEHYGHKDASVGSLLYDFMSHYHEAEEDRAEKTRAKYTKSMVKENVDADVKLVTSRMPAEKKKKIDAAIADLANDIANKKDIEEGELTSKEKKAAHRKYGGSPRIEPNEDVDNAGQPRKRAMQSYKKDSFRINPGYTRKEDHVEEMTSGRAASVVRKLLKGWHDVAHANKTKPAAKSSVDAMTKEPMPEDVKKKSDESLDEVQTIVKRVKQVHTSTWGGALRKIEAIQAKNDHHHKHRKADMAYMKQGRR